jgi:hypothetical protein
MKYAAIAALLIANTSATTAEGAACTTEPECGTTNRCAAVTKKNAAGAIPKMCVKPINCVAATKGDVTGSDSNVYTVNADACMYVSVKETTVESMWPIYSTAYGAVDYAAPIA